MLTNRVLNLINHIKRGTFFKRIAQIPQRRRYFKEEKRKQKFLNSNEKYFIANIENGLKLKLDRNQGLTKMFFLGFEKDELNFVKKYLRKGNKFVDIGSNIGLFSILASSIVGKSGKVISFEPVKKTYEKFEENILINKLTNISAYNLGISDVSGKGTIKTVDNFDALNSMGLPAIGTEFQEEEIGLTTIDSFFINNGKIDLMKIDVEGWELHLFQGGKNFFAQEEAPLLLVEFSETNLKNAGTSGTELAKLIYEYGYYLYYYNTEKNELSKLKGDLDNNYENLIAIKDSQISKVQSLTKIKIIRW